MHHVTVWVCECRCESHLSCGGRCSESLCSPPSPAQWLDASPAVPLCSLYCRSHRSHSPSPSSPLHAPSFSPSARPGLSDLARSVRSAAAGGDGRTQSITNQSINVNHVTTQKDEHNVVKTLALEGFIVRLFLSATSQVPKVLFNVCVLLLNGTKICE